MGCRRPVGPAPVGARERPGALVVAYAAFGGATAPLDVGHGISRIVSDWNAADGILQAIKGRRVEARQGKGGRG
jgi:hypothetical protein